jgi:hypothetical protein
MPEIAQSFLLRHLEEIRGVDQALGLLGDGARENRVAVAQAVHGDAGERIEVLAAVGVPEPGALAADERHGLRRVRVHQVRRGHGLSLFS